jgi:DMSO/TMAO reductase YedYZ molybdopterin-dependent catalytic subunit
MKKELSCEVTGMAYRKGWFQEPFGRRLRRLHAWNAWTLLALTVTGIALYVPVLRRVLGEGRVWLKQLHIGIGLLSVVLLLLYVPHLAKHWRQLRERWSQRGNLLLVLAIVAGWSVSGLVLWQFRWLPPEWSGVALFWHDALTWVGVPYALYHSISRSRWVKRASRAAAPQPAGAVRAAAVPQPQAAPELAAAPPPAGAARAAADAVLARLKETRLSRGAFLRGAAGLGLLLVVGPPFYRWLKGATDSGGAELQQIAADSGNRMTPDPVPLPDSMPPKGGGGRGNFRIYTVTDIPSFTSDTWKFALSGLVAKPQTFDWEQFLKLPRKVQVSDFHCVTGWSVTSVTWEGIPLKELLALGEPDTKAKYVKFYSGDGVYTDALSLEQAHMDDVMVAVLMDGKPIPQQLGGPVRLVVPKMYAYKSVKWLQGIELIDKEHIGYWELRGYDNDAWVPGQKIT